MSFPFVFEAFFVICVIAVENISYLMADVRYVPLYEKSAPEFQVRYRCYYVDMFFVSVYVLVLVLFTCIVA